MKLQDFVSRLFIAASFSFTFTFISDKPDRPSISAVVAVASSTLSSNQPEEGDDIVLTCSCSSSGVTEYEFMHGSTSLEKSPSATYTIRDAKLGSDDEIYTCIAYILAEPSIPSDPESLTCKFG